MATKDLNSPISVINLAQMDIRNGRKGFANASDYLETWDDPDIITTVNARKDLRHPTERWHNHSIIIISRFRGQLSIHKIVGADLRLELNNPRQLRFSNTSS